MKISDLTTNTTTSNLIKKLISCYNNNSKTDAMAIVKKHCKNTLHWIDCCCNVPRLHEIIMHAADELLGGHGIEFIEKENSHDCLRPIDFIDYINMGDSYAPTLFLDMARKPKFFVSTMADVVEKSGK